MTTADLVKLQTEALEAMIKNDAAHPCVNQMLWNFKLLLECQKIEAEITLTLAQAKGALEGIPPQPKKEAVVGPRIWPDGTTVFSLRDGGYTVNNQFGYDIVGTIAFVDQKAGVYAVDTKHGRIRIRMADLS